MSSPEDMRRRIEELEACIRKLEEEWRSRLEVSEDARARLGEQNDRLVELLDETRAELRGYWDEAKRNAAEGHP